MEGLPYECGDLTNTTPHAVLNILLLLFVCASSFIKVSRLLKRHSTLGLAYWYLLLGVLFSISQLCIAIQGSWGVFPAIICFHFAASLGLAALNPLLLLLMPFVIMACSQVVFRLTTKYRPDDPTYSRAGLTPRDGCHVSQPAPDTVSRAKSAGNAVIAVYIIIFLIPTILGFAMVHTSIDIGGVVYYLQIILYVQLITLPILAFGQFIPQFLLVWGQRRNLRKLPLDIESFILDAIVSTLIGISWHQFIAETRPFHAKFWYGITHPFSFQHWGVCLWLGYVLFGVGQGLVVLIYIYLRHRYSQKTVDWKAFLEEPVSDEASEITTLLGGG